MAGEEPRVTRVLPSSDLAREECQLFDVIPRVGWGVQG